MENKDQLLQFDTYSDLRLREIGPGDLEHLRQWKNDNKRSFFLNQDISPEQQQKWYDSFSKREHDHMFMVEQWHAGSWVSIGCMGFRKIEEEHCVDAYNIIRAHKIEPASFNMSDAFLGMLAYAASLHPELPLQVKVLAANPAVAWYNKNHFNTLRQVDNYVLMELNKQAIINIKWTKH